MQTLKIALVVSAFTFATPEVRVWVEKVGAP